MKSFFTILNYSIKGDGHEKNNHYNYTGNDISYSVLQGEIIEDYSDDKPFPSCLVLGTNKKNEVIHSVWAYNSENKWSVLITVYKPDPKLWLNWRKRRKKK